jgi:hypothetical protein
VFSKVKETFVTSLHLNSKEPNLGSDLLLPSSGNFLGLSIFLVNSLMIVVIIKGTSSLTSKAISWSNLFVFSLW